MEKIKGDALKYMGCNESVENDIELMNVLDECVEEMKRLSSGAAVFEVFDIKRTSEGVEIGDSGVVLTGSSILEHLEGCEKCAVLAATLGSGVDMRLRYYSKADLSRGIMLDACATAAVEKLCDEVQSSIESIANSSGYSITFRYSPGYGDLSLDVQPSLLRLVDAHRKIGLAASESLILTPRKSVTAIIGFSKGAARPKLTCEICSMNGKCEYQRRGNRCGN